MPNTWSPDPTAVPSLEVPSARLVLVPVGRHHAQAVFETFDAGITRYMTPKPAATIDETLAFIEASLADWRAGSGLQFAIVERAGPFIGCIGLHQIDTREPELGLWVRRSSHGQGYGLEAAGALVAWARANLDFDHIRYPVDVRNGASRRIPERLGGRVVRSFLSVSQAGLPLDQVEYHIGYKG